MSQKQKYKQKRKRGHHRLTLDFISPLTPEACVERLKAGRSPLPGHDLEVRSDDNRIIVDVVENRSRFRVIGARSREVIAPSRFSRHSTGIWFEGTLQPLDAGTQVIGEVKRDLDLFRSGVGCYTLLFFWGVIDLFLMLGKLDEWSVYVGLLVLPFVIVSGVVILLRRERARQSEIIAQWVADRLD